MAARYDLQVTSRAESAAATRRALLDAAAELLDLGGLESVTLRAVGARAGVTRGAPYRHFPDKESLLISIGTQAWDRLGEQTEALGADPHLSAAEKLRGAFVALVDIGRTQPHLYKLMFSNPAGDPTVMARAARRSQEQTHAMLTELVGEEETRHYAALLIASVNGIAGMEVSGQLADPKWGDLSAEKLIETLVRLIASSEVFSPGTSAPRKG